MQGGSGFKSEHLFTLENTYIIQEEFYVWLH